MANKEGLLSAILRKDPAAKNKLMILLFYPGVHAIILYRISNVFYRLKLSFLSYILSGFARFLTGIEIHPGAKIGQRCFIDHGFGVVIGETSIIEDDVTIYHGVTLGSKLSKEKIRHPHIGNHVVLGVHSTLLGCIHIGDESIIGAHAIVLKDVAAKTKIPPGTVYRKEGL